MASQCRADPRRVIPASPAFARDGAQADVQAGQVGERFAALAQQVGDQQRSEPVLVFERLGVPPCLVSDGRRKGRRQRLCRFYLASPIGEPAGLVEVLVVDQRAGGAVAAGIGATRRRELLEQPGRAFDGGVDLREFFAERVDVGDGERGGLFLAAVSPFPRSSSRPRRESGQARRRRYGDAPAHRMGARQFVGGRAKIHFGVVENEVFEVDEFAGEPEAGAGVVKMRAGVKTVAQGAGAQALVEAARASRRRRRPSRGRCRGAKRRSRQGEFGPLQGVSANLVSYKPLNRRRSRSEAAVYFRYRGWSKKRGITIDRYRLSMVIKPILECPRCF